MTIEVRVERWTGTNWETITNWVRSLRIRETDLAQATSCDLEIYNENNRFSTDPDKLTPGQYIRVQARTNTLWYTPFLGRIKELDHPLPTRTFAYIRVYCIGHSSLKLLDETITKDYYDLGIFCGEAIWDFIRNPDSGQNTGFTLITDGGAIVNTLYPRNLSRVNLMRAMRHVCESLGYAGYLSRRSEIDAEHKVTIKCFRSDAYTLESSGLNLSHPFEEVQYNIQKPKGNCLLVWGNKDWGYPTVEDWTENGYQKGIWTAPLANTYIFDSGTTCPDIPTSTNSLGVARSESEEDGVVQARLSLPDAKYTDPITGNVGYIDLITKNRFNRLDLYFWHNMYFMPDEMYLKIILELTTGETATKKIKTDLWMRPEEWYNVGDNFKFGSTDERATWTVATGFNWKPSYITIECPIYATASLLLDGLRFEGKGYSIDPTVHPTLNPRIEDAVSQSQYGKTLLHITEFRDRISNFELAQAIGKEVITITKNPAETFEITLANPEISDSVRPAKSLIFTLPERGISSETFRILSIEHSWRRVEGRWRTGLTIAPVNLDLDYKSYLADVFIVFDKFQIR